MACTEKSKNRRSRTPSARQTLNGVLAGVQRLAGAADALVHRQHLGAGPELGGRATDDLAALEQLPVRQVRELAEEVRALQDGDDGRRRHEHRVEAVDARALRDGPGGSLGQGAQEPLLDVGEIGAGGGGDLRDADDFSLLQEGHAEEALHPVARGRGVRLEERLAGGGDDAGEPGPDGDGAARAIGRAAHRGAHPQELAVAEEDGGRVGAVRRLQEHAEQAPEQGREVALLEGCAGDALERHETSGGLVALAGAELDVAAAELLALAEEVRERLHPRPQDVGVVRLGDVVRGPGRVPAAQVLLVAVDGGEEDDRHLAARLGGPDARGALEAIHLRHLDVEQDHREGALGRLLQSLQPRPCRHHLEVQRLQHGLERHQVGRRVVHQEDPRRSAAFSLGGQGHRTSLTTPGCAGSRPWPSPSNG
jgi:hypothetical protein